MGELQAWRARGFLFLGRDGQRPDAAAPGGVAGNERVRVPKREQQNSALSLPAIDSSA
jgi:hypothetical protein